MVKGKVNTLGGLAGPQTSTLLKLKKKQSQRLRTLGAAQTRWEGIHAFPDPSR